MVMTDYREGLVETYRSWDAEELLAQHRRGTLTEIAYAILEAELRERGIALPERPRHGIFESELSQSSLRAHWEGRAPLSSAFWLIGLSAHALFVALIELFFVPFQVGLEPKFGKTDTSIVLYFIWVYLVAFWPLILAYVCIWRCSKNTEWRGWTYLARLALILNLPNIFLMSLWPAL